MSIKLQLDNALVPDNEAAAESNDFDAEYRSSAIPVGIL